MAESVLTLDQLVTINDRNLADVTIPNFLDDSPFIRVAAAVVASNDTTHKWLTYTHPGAAFRDANDGREVQVSVDTMVSADCKILDASFRVDVALAESWRNGAPGWLNREAARSLRAAFAKAERQVFYGTTATLGDTKGFAGLINHSTLDAIADPMVVNKAGTTAGAQTSVYLVRFGEEDVELIIGRGGNISIGTPTIQETAGATGTFPAYYTPVFGWLGLKIGSTVTSAVRICNVETALDDDDIYTAISKFGATRGPNACFMNRKAAELLRKSRTATNVTGAPAPMPETVGNGIPLYITEGLLNTEAIET